MVAGCDQRCIRDWFQIDRNCADGDAGKLRTIHHMERLFRNESPRTTAITSGHAQGYTLPFVCTSAGNSDRRRFGVAANASARKRTRTAARWGDALSCKRRSAPPPLSNARAAPSDPRNSSHQFSRDLSARGSGHDCSQRNRPTRDGTRAVNGYAFRIVRQFASGSSRQVTAADLTGPHHADRARRGLSAVLPDSRLRADSL